MSKKKRGESCIIRCLQGVFSLTQKRTLKLVCIESHWKIVSPNPHNSVFLSDKFLTNRLRCTESHQTELPTISNPYCQSTQVKNETICEAYKGHKEIRAVCTSANWMISDESILKSTQQQMTNKMTLDMNTDETK